MNLPLRKHQGRGERRKLINKEKEGSWPRRNSNYAKKIVFQTVTMLKCDNSAFAFRLSVDLFSSELSCYFTSFGSFSTDLKLPQTPISNSCSQRYISLQWDFCSFAFASSSIFGALQTTKQTDRYPSGPF